MLYTYIIKCSKGAICMKDLRKLPGRKDFKHVKGKDVDFKYYCFDVSEILGKSDAMIVVTEQRDCVQIAIHIKGCFPDFEDCVKVKQFIFDEDEAVFLVLKNLRIIDSQNLEIRMFYSKEINELASKMDFKKEIEESFLVFSEKRPMIKAKRQIAGKKVNVVAMEKSFPPLKDIEETYRFTMKLPLVAIKDSKTALNTKHMIFVCEGEHLKLPKSLLDAERLANLLRK